MSDPEFSFGKGRNQIKVNGEEAVRETATAIRWLLFARAFAIALAAVALAALARKWALG